MTWRATCAGPWLKVMVARVEESMRETRVRNLKERDLV